MKQASSDTGADPLARFRESDSLKRKKLLSEIANLIVSTKATEPLTLRFLQLNAFDAQSLRIFAPTSQVLGLPEEILLLDQKLVEIEGFIIPIDFVGQTTPEFVLVVDPLVCCFGQVPAVHEWIHVFNRDNPAHLSLVDIPVRVRGRFKIRPTWEEETLTGLYRMDEAQVFRPPDLE